MKDRFERSTRQIPLLFAIGIFLVTCIGVWLVFWFVIQNAFENVVDKLPFSLHSVLSASYLADPLDLSIPAIQINIIPEVVRDLEGEDRPLAIGVGTLIALLQTPVPTVTPMSTGMPGIYTPTPPSYTPIPQPDGSATITPFILPTYGTGTPAITLTPTITPSPSLTSTWSFPTATLWFYTPTATSVRPTQPVPTSTPTSTAYTQPTATQPLLTITSQPLTPTPTLPPPTSPPPTATQVPIPSATTDPYPPPTIPPYP